jgi:hypothetical protein
MSRVKTPGVNISSASRFLTRLPVARARAARYQHMTDPIRQEIAKRVGGLIWQTTDPAPDRSAGEDDDGAAGALLAA